MKACYVEVFKENFNERNLYFRTQPTRPKEALSVAESIAKELSKAFKDPVFYRDAEADRQYLEGTGVEIHVWELAKNEDDLDINHRHIIIKERN